MRLNGRGQTANKLNCIKTQQYMKCKAPFLPAELPGTLIFTLYGEILTCICGCELCLLMIDFFF